VDRKKNARLEGRNGRIWRDYCRGANMATLAERYDLSIGRISQICAEVRDGLGEEVRNEVIAQEAELLRTLRDEVLAEVYDAMPAPVTAGKDGDIVKDPETGETVRDHAGRLAGLAAANNLTMRLHRLLGIDAPAKLDLNMNGEEERAKQAGAEAVAYLHGGNDDPA
jgi:hypothetical protein